MTVRFEIPASPWGREGHVSRLLERVFDELKKKPSASCTVEFVFTTVAPNDPVRFRMTFLSGASRRSRRPVMTRKPGAAGA